MEKLKNGDKVAIVSLSSGILGESFVSHELELGIKRLKEFGLVPVFMKNSLRGLDFIANNPKERFLDLKDAFLDKDIKAIITAIGGIDSFKILPFIFEDKEFKDIVKNNPKIFIGYSDTTTSHLALNKLGLPTFYGPAFITDFAEFENDMLPYTKNAVSRLFEGFENFKVLSSEYWYDERKDFSPNAVGTNRIKHTETRGYEIIKNGDDVTGQLFGGCIELITSLSGYKSENDKFFDERNDIISRYKIVPTKSDLKGKILFLETSDEKPSPENYRAMIKYLISYGLFDEISGLITGKPMDETYYEEYKQILKEELKNYNFPILSNFNFGHSFPRTILPYGAKAVLSTKNHSLVILNSCLDGEN